MMKKHGKLQKRSNAIVLNVSTKLDKPNTQHDDGAWLTAVSAIDTTAPKTKARLTI